MKAVLDSRDYDVSPQTGFVPEKPPLVCLQILLTIRVCAAFKRSFCEALVLHMVHILPDQS